MGHKSKSKKEIESVGILLFIFNKKLPLIAVTVAAVIISIIASLLITPRYSSSVVLYPATFTNMSRGIFDPSPLRTDIMAFGLESDSERLLQILQSEAINDWLMEKYNLKDHYNIGHESKYPRTKVFKKMERNITFRKTDFRAIEIEVLDTDPVIAANMANDIAGYIDSVTIASIRERANMTVEIIKEEYLSVKADLEILQDSLKKIREMGILQYESVAGVITEAHATAILIGDRDNIKYFGERIDQLAQYGGVYTRLRDDIGHLTSKMHERKFLLDEALVNVEKMLPYKFVVDEANVAERKSYPVRSLIVIVSAMSAFLFTLFFMLIVESVKPWLPVKE